MTRKIVFMMSVSLDGFFEGLDRELGWQRVDVEPVSYTHLTLPTKA